MVPLGKTLTGDPRCSLLLGDFFEMVLSGSGCFGAGPDAQQVAVILLASDDPPDAVFDRSLMTVF
jgi:hypothetical protein